MDRGFFQKLGDTIIEYFQYMQQKADTATIEHCYTMILGRAALKEELVYWGRMVALHKITKNQLISTFERSDEAKAHRRAVEWQITSGNEHYIHKIQIDHISMYVSTDDYFVGLGLARDAAYEPELSKLLKETLKPSDIFVDIGANIGYFSLLAASIVGPSGRVFAFEPNKKNGALLWLSSIANNYQNIELIPFAAADQEQEMVLHVSGSNGRMLSSSEIAIYQQKTDHSPGMLSIRTTTVDQILRNRERVNVIKIDVEGAEPFVLAGMSNTILRHKPVIFSEFSPVGIKQTTNQAPELYLETILQYGYDIYIITKSGQIKAPNNYQELLTRFFSADADHIDIVCYPI